MKVSVVQSEPKLLDKQHNLQLHSDLINSLETDLLVLPELCTSGYVFEAKNSFYP